MRQQFSSTDESVIDEDQSTFQRFQKAFKKFVFSSFCQIIGDEPFSNFIRTVFFIIETMQVLQFAFKPQILILMLLDVSLISYINQKQIKKEKNSNQNNARNLTMMDTSNMPVYIFKIFTEIFLQILFLPFLEIFLNVFQCIQDNQGRTVHKDFTEVKCFTGTYIVHTIVAILGVIILVSIGIVISMLFFDCRIKNTYIMAKNHGRNEKNFVIFKTIMAVFFSTMLNDSFTILLIVFYVFGSLILFESVNKSIVYHQFWVIQHGINIWTAIILIFAKVTIDILFDATIYVWIIGLVVVILIVYLRKENNYELLLIDTNKIENINVFLMQLDYLIKYMKYYHDNENVAVLFDGFVEYHKTICMIDDCPSKKKFSKTKKYSKIFTDESETEEIIMLVHLIDSFYMNALQKYPNNTTIRINRSLFLLDRFKQKQQALQELLLAEIDNPSLEEQFIIYRFKKIIEIEIVREKHIKDSGENMTELSFQNHLNSLRNNIEKSAYFHSEFWGQLMEEIPDLVKMTEIGYKINIVNNLIDEHWKYLMSLNIDMQIMMRFYARFLMWILNDKERYIMNLNLAAASIFGFTKNELQINLIMPTMYSKYHDKFIEHYLVTLEGQIMNKEKLLPARNKLNYIVPVYLTVKHVSSVVSGIQFCGAFRLEKAFRNYGYLLVDKDGNIENISSGITPKKILKKKLKINDLINDFLNNVGEFLDNKQGSIAKVKTYLNENDNETETLMLCNALGVTFKSYSLQGYFIRFEKCLNNETQPDLTSTMIKTKKMNQTLSNKKYFSMKYDISSRSYIGEIKEGVISTNSKGLMNTSKETNLLFSGIVDQSVAYDNLDTSMNPGNMSSLRVEMKANANESRLLKKLEEQSARDEAQDTRFTSDKIEYGQGIRILRLYQGRIIDAEEMKKDEDSAEEEDEEKKSKEETMKKNENIEDEDDEEVNAKNVFKNRKVFLAFMKDTKFLENKYITRLKLVAICILICFGILGFVNYFLNHNTLTSINNGYYLSKYGNQRVSLTQRILYNVIELILLNKKIIVQAHESQTKKDEYRTKLHNILHQSILKLESTQKYLQMNSFSMTDLHNKIFKEDLIKLTFLEQNQKIIRYFDINEATNLVTINKLIKK